MEQRRRRRPAPSTLWAPDSGSKTARTPSFSHKNPITVSIQYPKPEGTLTCKWHVVLHGSIMDRKVARTELDAEEYRALAKIAEGKGLTIKDALREAALRWTREESGIDPKDPIFDIALGRRKAQDWGRGTERTSIDHDKVLYRGSS